MSNRYWERLLPIIFLSLTLISFSVKSQDQSIQRTFKIAALAKSYNEGFQKNTAKQEEKSWINENYSQRKEERKAMG